MLYDKHIQNPFNFDGAASRITSLAAHQRILDSPSNAMAKFGSMSTLAPNNRAAQPSLHGMFSFADALDKIADGATAQGRHLRVERPQPRAEARLANALAINTVERDGRIPIVTSANCLQADGQNDNGWDQGLLFLNPSQVWLQPPGYVTQMFSRNYLPHLVECQVTGTEGRLDANAKRSDDRKTLILQVVNSSEKAMTAQIHLAGFVPGNPVAQVSELSGPLEAVNTADKPRTITPQQIVWKHGIKDGQMSRTFRAHLFTVLRFD